MWGSPRPTLSHLQQWFGGFANSQVLHHSREDPQHGIRSRCSRSTGETYVHGVGGQT